MKKILIILLTALFLCACEKEQIQIKEPELIPIDSINPDVPLWAGSYS